MKFCKTQLKQIKSDLPHGGMTRIAETLGVSRQFVSQVFSGDLTITESCMPVLTEASKLIAEEKQKAEEFSKSLTATMNGAA